MTPLTLVPPSGGGKVWAILAGVGLLLSAGMTPAWSQTGPADNTGGAASLGPRVFLLDGTRLAMIRTRPDPALRPALEQLNRDAARALRYEPVPVTAKKRTPPSGDKHDYMSLARYWWPDPDKPDGLPYVRRDGEVNPEIESYPDHQNLDELVKVVHTLALASYLLQPEQPAGEDYAARAAELLRLWFLNADTRMNPNLNFSQAVPGRTQGRGAGVLDGRGFAQIADAVGLLSSSPAWTAQDQQGMHIWFRQYLKWLQESPNGRDEAAARNNHGTWYDVQLTAVAFFVGDTGLARRTLEASLQKRITAQIEPDGRQPEELARTRALSYSLFNLEALAQLAALGRHGGVDIWGFQTPDGRGIRRAAAWVLGKPPGLYDMADVLGTGK